MCYRFLCYLFISNRKYFLSIQTSITTFTTNFIVINVYHYHFEYLNFIISTCCINLFCLFPFNVYPLSVLFFLFSVFCNRRNNTSTKHCCIYKIIYHFTSYPNFMQRGRLQLCKHLCHICSTSSKHINTLFSVQKIT